jgi:hypothetical protein
LCKGHNIRPQFTWWKHPCPKLCNSKLKTQLQWVQSTFGVNFGLKQISTFMTNLRKLVSSYQLASFRPQHIGIFLAFFCQNIGLSAPHKDLYQWRLWTHSDYTCSSRIHSIYIYISRAIHTRKLEKLDIIPHMFCISLYRGKKY